MKSDEHSHLINCCARAVQRDMFRAECNALVHGYQHARDGKPTCPDCARIAEEDEQSLLAMGAIQTMTQEQRREHFGGDPVETKVGNPLSGYRRKA